MVDEAGKTIEPTPGEPDAQTDTEKRRRVLDEPPKTARANPKADREAQAVIAEQGRWVEVMGVGKAGILSALARAGYEGEVTQRGSEVWARAGARLTEPAAVEE